MQQPFRFAICNECFGQTPFSAACKAIRRAGYEGIEIAPFTLAEDPASLTADQRAEIRKAFEGEGLAFAGLHWLLVSPPGMHVTTPDEPLRKRSWEYIRRLTDLCADLGPDGVMVFGSPKQRCATGGLTPGEATRLFVEGLASVAEHAQQRGVTILIEALPANQTDVVQSLAEAVRLVEEIGSPAVRTMFDTHNAVDETEPHSALVDRYFDYIRHVHVNETDGRHPGQGDYDFKPLLDVLQRRNYTGWISVEAFDFSPGGERIAQESLRHLKAALSAAS